MRGEEQIALRGGGLTIICPAVHPIVATTASVESENVMRLKSGSLAVHREIAVAPNHGFRIAIAINRVHCAVFAARRLSDFDAADHAALLLNLLINP